MTRTLIPTDETKSQQGCNCRTHSRKPKRILLTGGPGAGKTAILELARQHFCKHVAILPEAATILFQGGFPRKATVYGKKGLQRTIYYVQREIERMAFEEPPESRASIVLCDRGTVDGLAYWPGSSRSYFQELNTTRKQEFDRYSMVIHLKTPSHENGYNKQNPYRIEEPKAAEVIDEKILRLWKGHKNHFVIRSSVDFMKKARLALELIYREIPDCCKKNSHFEI